MGPDLGLERVAALAALPHARHSCCKSANCGKSLKSAGGDGQTTRAKSLTVATGEYRDFPNYPTDSLDFSPGQANMLADLTGWTVKHNVAEFARVIGSAPS